LRRASSGFAPNSLEFSTVYLTASQKYAAQPASAAAAHRGRDGRGDGGGDRLVALLLRDAVVLEHVVDEDVAPLLVRLEVLGLVDAQRRGVVDRGDEARGLRDAEVLRVDAVVVLRGGLDAVDAAAVVGDVEVAEQDVVLRELLLQADGEAHLLELAGGRLLRRLRVGLLARLGIRLRERLRLLHEHVLHVLHGDGARARLDAAADDVLGQGAERGLHVHAAVLVEARVLGVDGRRLGVVRHLVPADLLAVLRVELRELDGLAALRRVQLGLLREVVDLQVVRQVLEESDRVVGGEARDGDGRGDHRSDQHAGHGAHAEDARQRGGDAAGRVRGSRHRLQSTGRVYGNPWDLCAGGPRPSRHASRPDRQGAEMTATPGQWEYLTTPLMIHNTAAILNTWGSQGWELVQVVTGPEGGLVAYMKRPVAGEHGA
jgi:hypothetical protein